MTEETDEYFNNMEKYLIEKARPDFEGRGYKFIVEPAKEILPDFFGSYRPDAVALGGTYNVAIEVKFGDRSKFEKSLENIQKIFVNHPDWQLLILHSGDRDLALKAQTPTSDQVQESIENIELLIGLHQLRAAFLLSWSVLEAVANFTRLSDNKKPLNSRELVQILGLSGQITSNADHRLRGLINLRNRIVHGDLAAEPRKDDIIFMVDTIKGALNFE